MSSPFTARRKARIIRQNDDYDVAPANTLAIDPETPKQGKAVRP